ncbi:cytochrome C assembly family protein [Thalassotalea agarivorans]|uniref:ABC-type uncharacterized transport system, permease component n=1 Tax=Thalassotalea agarivorans TaxID=349064 RepID=A0A1I0ALK9_THASX|nr:cytochrome c biogenesis protein CcsA [Thalassotalea agarivorans]SES95177.1 ABC-type uncharacterized transport system, permease component [Thalassotalea agarivorans]
MHIATVFTLVAILGYTIATFAVLSRLFHHKGPNLLFVQASALVAIIAHVLLVSGSFDNQPLNFSLPNVVSIVSLVIALFVSGLALRYKINLILPVAYGFSAIWLTISLLIPTIENMPLIAGKLVLVTHITLALIAYCILVIATLYCYQVAYINFKLKQKNLAAVTHLPPLMQVEQQLFLILAVGTLTLLLSQLTGFIFLDNFISKENAHKTVLSLMALGLYCVILWGHFKQGWRGHRIVTLTTIATILLTLSYFGSRFVKEFLLS